MAVDWTKAECREMDPWDFDHATYDAREACKRCPIRTGCGDDALRQGGHYDIFRAGMWFDSRGIIRNPRHLSWVRSS